MMIFALIRSKPNGGRVIVVGHGNGVTRIYHRAGSASAQRLHNAALVTKWLARRSVLLYMRLS